MLLWTREFTLYQHWTADRKCNTKMPCLCPLPSLPLQKIPLPSKTRCLSVLSSLMISCLLKSSTWHLPLLSIFSFIFWLHFDSSVFYLFLLLFVWGDFFFFFFAMALNLKTGICELISALAKWLAYDTEAGWPQASLLHISNAGQQIIPPTEMCSYS